MSEVDQAFSKVEQGLLEKLNIKTYAELLDLAESYKKKVYPVNVEYDKGAALVSKQLMNKAILGKGELVKDFAEAIKADLAMALLSNNPVIRRIAEDIRDADRES